ncbi:hypothetical protein E2562_025910 [Oryza meyeriana var. granulata]|uniref:Conserved oligomeric Golgi complex subunit 2 n=1 Tax=Oryza meyeriana var. granulata TaxID=110450 RepID=A0A6G1CIW4_9ORYZ|nr:hypothetical protein E2562_025910 [Oryza meyeriana var. granulata]
MVPSLSSWTRPRQSSTTCGGGTSTETLDAGEPRRRATPTLPPRRAPHLRAELVGLINRDHADFVGLSERLKGVDAAAARAPLVELRDKVAGFRGSGSRAPSRTRAAGGG